MTLIYCWPPSDRTYRARGNVSSLAVLAPRSGFTAFLHLGVRSVKRRLSAPGNPGRLCSRTVRTRPGRSWLLAGEHRLVVAGEDDPDCGRGAQLAEDAIAGIALLLRFPRRRRILVSGRRVNGRRSRSHATARRAAIDAVAASWTIGSEEGGCVLRRACRLG